MPHTFMDDFKSCDKEVQDYSEKNLENEAHRPTTLPDSHSAPALDRKSAENKSDTETKGDTCIYGPAGTREASVKWFKTTQAKNLIPDCAPITTTNSLYAEWFHGIITRRESERLLEDCDVGCFLIRLGESRLGYTLSFRDKTRCRHYMIDYSDSNQLYHVLGEPNKQASLSEVVEYYQQNHLQNWSGLLTDPCPQDEGTCDYLELVITPQDEQSLDSIWGQSNLYVTAPLYESSDSSVQAGGEYGIALTQHTTANPASVTRALNNLLQRNRRPDEEEEEVTRYTAEPVRKTTPEPLRQCAGPVCSQADSNGPEPDMDQAYCELDELDNVIQTINVRSEDNVLHNNESCVLNNKGTGSVVTDCISSGSSVSSMSSGSNNISTSSGTNNHVNSSNVSPPRCDVAAPAVCDIKRRPLPALPRGDSLPVLPPPLPLRSHH